MNELWFKIKYSKYLKRKEITLTVREGIRDKFHPKGYRIGENVLIRCFEKPGKDEFRAMAIIINLVFKKISELSDDDLIGCPPDSISRESAKRTLESIYRRNFSEDEVITLVEFDYLDR